MRFDANVASTLTRIGSSRGNTVSAVSHTSIISSCGFSAMKKKAPGQVVIAAASANSTPLLVAFASDAPRAITSVYVGSPSIRPAAPKLSHVSGRAASPGRASRW